VLTLNGYNNSAALSNDTSAPNTPIPSGIDTNLENCLNQTIGAAVPLIDGAMARGAGSFGGIGMLSLFIVLFQVLSF